MLQKWRESLAVGVYLIPEEIILFSLKIIQTLCNPGDVFQLLMGGFTTGELLEMIFSKIPDGAEMSSSSPQPAQVTPSHPRSVHFPIILGDLLPFHQEPKFVSLVSHL